jgi:hypothetical protein
LIATVALEQHHGVGIAAGAFQCNAGVHVGNLFTDRFRQPGQHGPVGGVRRHHAGQILNLLPRTRLGRVVRRKIDLVAGEKKSALARLRGAQMITQLHGDDADRTLQCRLRQQAVAAFHQPDGGAHDQDQRQKADHQARAHPYCQPASSEHR